MDRLFVNPNLQALWTQTGLDSVAAAVRRFLPDYQKRQKVTVQRVTLQRGDQSVDAFFKLYHHREGGWRFWLRRSKARIEFENYLTFERLGIAAAEPIACGEERDVFGRLHRDFILTQAVPNAVGLDEYIRASTSRDQRLNLEVELAAMLRRLHRARFFYYDMVWRNILVSSKRDGAAQIVFIDCPRGGFARAGRRRKALRDLASLDKMASQLCSRAVRLRFVLRYFGKSRLDDSTRAFVKDCLQYRRMRWPEDWHG